ncbi:MAG: hypothetical protein IOD12_09795 [Silvanigrellales bacterium]|jgi:hypothetical protein|nr:hypothetical protein [Silvanigrellales bacterium]
MFLRSPLFLVLNADSTPSGTSPEAASASPATTPEGLKIKTLPPSVVKDIEQKNIARRLAGLSPISIKVRRCIACGAPFESAGNRTCGCSSRTAGTIAGREII